MSNYTIGYVLAVDGGPQRFCRNTITGAPSPEEVITLFKTVMKYACITRVDEATNEQDFSCPVTYCELEQMSRYFFVRRKSEFASLNMPIKVNGS